MNDVVLRSIISGANLTVFANTGSLKKHHLRVLVTMPRTSLYVIKMVAREPGTNPAKAIDYSSSAAMARTLIKIRRDISRFALYEQECFHVSGKRLHGGVAIVFGVEKWCIRCFAREFCSVETYFPPMFPHGSTVAGATGMKNTWRGMDRRT